MLNVFNLVCTGNPTSVGSLVSASSVDADFLSACDVTLLKSSQIPEHSLEIIMISIYLGTLYNATSR